MGRPRLIILVRHGESESNCDKSINRYIPNHKVSLTDRGHEQAKQAGKNLRDVLLPGENVLIYTSPYRRTRETTQGIVSQLDGVDYRVYEEPRLREQDFGNFQFEEDEMAKIWKERALYGHFFYRIPNGESAADVYDRCAGFNETLFRQFSSEKFANVLVLVTHGLMTRVFLMKWYRWTVEQFENLKNINYCEFVIMELQENGRYLLKNKMRTWSDPPSDPIITKKASSADEERELEEKQRKIKLLYNSLHHPSSANSNASVASATPMGSKTVIESTTHSSGGALVPCDLADDSSSICSNGE
ncbi:histidine phosphatase superfamily [Dipodascopsis uninucleata]